VADFCPRIRSRLHWHSIAKLGRVTRPFSAVALDDEENHNVFYTIGAALTVTLLIIAAGGLKTLAPGLYMSGLLFGLALSRD
jgi:hypothetical protein